MKVLMQLLPEVFRAVERDSWHSRLNFFMLLKALVQKPGPGSKIQSQSLKMFGALLINCLPHIEDEPKVAVTEILNIVLPVYLEEHNQPSAGQKKNKVVQTIKQLLTNLTENLKRSDEVEASSIAVFNLVCRVFDMREEYACLAPLEWPLDTDALCPFNFHALEAVRYSYNLLIYKFMEAK
jgi:hypothetical protein